MDAGLTPKARATLACPTFLTKSFNEIFSTAYTSGVYERGILADGYSHINQKIRRRLFLMTIKEANGSSTNISLRLIIPK